MGLPHMLSSIGWFDSTDRTKLNSGYNMIDEMVEELKILSIQLETLEPTVENIGKRMAIMHAFYDRLNELPSQDAANYVLNLVNSN